MMSMQWIGALSVIVVGIVLLIGLAACQARYPMHPEAIRKLLHVGMGLTALSFPWLFRDIEPVLGVVGAAMVILVAVRKAPYLRRFGTVLDGVARSSRGDVFFLVAIAALFALSGGDALMFGVPILVLTLADTAAALVGIRYGRARLTIAAGDKSVAGSIAFFIVAFVCASIPVVLLGHAELPAVLAGAAILACVTTTVEALAGNGLDNLLVPLAAFASLPLLTGT